MLALSYTSKVNALHSKVFTFTKTHVWVEQKLGTVMRLVVNPVNKQ